MSDIKDILGVPRAADGEGTGKQQAAKKMERPKGMSREAFALLGDSHPIMSSQFAEGLKKQDIIKKPKPSTKGIPTYQQRPFKNSARTDGLELTHWVKCYKSATGVIKEPEEDYHFAKFNKKVQLLKYDDEEYEALIKPDSGDWSRQETDFLYDLVERFDLRWPVITDRFEQYVGPSGQPPAPTRTMEDLKERYFAIARKLLIAREGGEAAVANHVLVKHPYNKQHEMDRKAALQTLLTRTSDQAKEENAVLAEARQIEERRRADSAAARRAAVPAAGTPAVGGPPRNASPAVQAGRAGGASAASGGAGQGGAAATAAAGPRQLSPPPVLLVSELRHPEDFPSTPGYGVPSLFDHELRPIKLKHGVYARGAHTLKTAETMATNITGGAKAFKNVETVLSELGWPAALTGPTINTRPVCGAWLALRSEVVAQQELKRSLQARMGGDGGAGAASGGRRPEKRKK